MSVARSFTTALALLLLAAPALAQTMSPPPGTLGTLPSGPTTQPTAPAAAALPDVDSPRTFLMAARQALSEGRLPEAGVALEQAETRVLTRSVLATRRQRPSGQSLVATIADARTALAASDRGAALRKINEALHSRDLDETPQ